jgi:hypothetical protein
LVTPAVAGVSTESHGTSDVAATDMKDPNPPSFLTWTVPADLLASPSVMPMEKEVKEDAKAIPGFIWSPTSIMD